MRLSPRRATGLAWSAFATTVLFAVAAVVFGIVDHGTPLPESEGAVVSAIGQLVFAVITIAFAALGALLASRRPANPIGWILCLSPVALSFTGMAGGWYQHSLFADPGSLPLAPGLAWAANWLWVLGFMPLLTWLLLLFPDGHAPSRRWHTAGWVAMAAMSMLILGYAFAPGVLEDYPHLVNPLGVAGPFGPVFEAFKGVGFFLFAAAAVGSMASLVMRFRRSHGEQRQQLRWMAAAAVLVVASWIATAIFDQLLGIDISLALTAGLLALPVATTIAVLRYRLYDLDLVVNRTLVYGSLTAILAGTYLLGVLLLQLALEPLTDDSDLAVAGSTVAVAALVRPARLRIQRLVDRRFYRRKYDAVRTVESFSVRIRDDVDLDALGADLREVARDTMQPSHVSLWLRPDAVR